MSLVRMEQVVKRYGSRLSIDHLSLSVREGEIFGLLGPNGAGKSTTIHMLCGLLRPDHGDIRVGGWSVLEHPLEVKRLIGLVPQELAIYERLTAWENVAFFAKLHGLRGRLLQERVEEALAFTGLLDRRNERPVSFSGGLKRRLNIACALAHRPRLIIMDEPTVGIDPRSRHAILDAVRQLNRMGSTFIYSSHYMEEVEAIGDRVGILDKGRLLALGTQQELRAATGSGEKLCVQLAQPLTPAAVAELEAHPRIRRVMSDGRKIELYMTTADASLQDILFILSKHGAHIHSLTRIEPNLESLFLSLTGRSLQEEGGGL
ncbi:ABC transporter ATP-binding protein [Paenibacillus sp. YYML68]|uniref:ABC transporter ATP-binding protein n=1 Tax=Paenibacillus sp. YYML68 TaxID=2909250 RepID=UPI002492B945|nr:ABC transporter ATP-binding protein [Paenibacillus sp. YYML68]